MLFYTGTVARTLLWSAALHQPRCNKPSRSKWYRGHSLRDVASMRTFPSRDTKEFGSPIKCRGWSCHTVHPQYNTNYNF